MTLRGKAKPKRKYVSWSTVGDVRCWQVRLTHMQKVGRVALPESSQKYMVYIKVLRGGSNSEGSGRGRMNENQLAPWEYEKLCLSGKPLPVLGLLSCFCHPATPAPQIPRRPECIWEAADVLTAL